METDGESEFRPVAIDESDAAITSGFFEQLKVAGHLCGAPFRNLCGRLCPGRPLRSRGVSTPFQLAVDQLQERLGRLGQVVGVGGAQLVAVQEHVADPFQFP
ncbi:hypothetical protein [Paenarthrobacter sp. TA1.8]|uniref:hypothetical protein n=1 Tax=Paenarthrobacter sp. TA1.8 TaxID=3400219 RepID=UPI003B43BECF